VASLVVNTFPQAILEVLHPLLQHGGRNCCHFFPDVLFQIHRCPWFLFVHLALEISSEEEVLRLGTLVPMNIEVPTKYPLSQDRIVVFEIRLHSKSPMPYRPALHGNWNALSIARRALKHKFPTPAVLLTTVLQNHQVFLLGPVVKGSDSWSRVVVAVRLKFCLMLCLSVMGRVKSYLHSAWMWFVSKPRSRCVDSFHDSLQSFQLYARM